MDRVVLVADLWSLIAADQLHGVAVLLRSGASVFSLFPLCRSIIEHCCTLVWVLDPQASPEVRGARAALAIDRSNEELCKAAAHLGGKGSSAHSDRRRVMRDHRTEVAAAFPIDTDLSCGKVAGEVRIGPTDVLRHFGSRWGDAREWEGVYDYLCAAATHPSLAGFEFFAADDDGNVMPSVPVSFLDRLLRATFVPFLKAMEHFQLYCGWEDEPLSDLIDAANAVFPELLTD